MLNLIPRGTGLVNVSISCCICHLGKGKGAIYPNLFSVGITTWMTSGKVDDRLALGAGRLQRYPKIDSYQGQVMASSPSMGPAGKLPRLSTGMTSWSSKGMQSSRGSTATPPRFLACPHMNRSRSTDWNPHSALHRGDPFGSSTSSPNRETFWIYGLGESLGLLENMQIPGSLLFDNGSPDPNSSIALRMRDRRDASKGLV
ncbi:hypothetical protein QBC33DRAFT_34152 [Phialemonium atrogriseum]|uniref:Uncharacterized protein n=1 Tax=Phialemonium atrogriseum TaxID=1093897 RepID=A0AAJ0CAF4_9PEZI|nr:uncharacterized protein QBC33DRAFT_34152 [Phialemonium atrogriseum]KAK1772936.1 hypothetical protein QBC33DRAFT_34152 [Phialemonium atrogriseum]